MRPGSRGGLSECEPLEYDDKNVWKIRLPKLDIFSSTLMFLTIAAIPVNKYVHIRKHIYIYE